MPSTFLYFAYGSTMYSRRLVRRIRSAIALGSGFVEGYQLAFDKVSVDRSGKCNISPTADGGGRVYGVLYSIDQAEAQNLDRAAGLGKGYRKSNIRVRGAAGARDTVAYIADRTDPVLRPYDWYKEFVIRGAIEHRLPASYIRNLQLTDSMPDPNRDRSARNKALMLRI
jgi:hypothetical protein